MIKSKFKLVGLFVIILNIIVFLGWVHLAIHFDKWWLALFSWVGMMSYKSNDNEQNKTPTSSSENQED